MAMAILFTDPRLPVWLVLRLVLALGLMAAAPAGGAVAQDRAAPAVAAAAPGAPAAAPAVLGPYRIQPGSVTVSGISSGGYMAGQLLVALSATIRGAGIIAAGPYYCARNSLTFGLYRCMETTLGAPSVPELVKDTRGFAAVGLIDPLEGLRQARLYLFHGSRDATVTEPVALTLEPSLRELGVPAENMVVNFDLPAAHAMITEEVARPCDATGAPYLNDCAFDLAGAVLGQLYGPLAPRVAATGEPQPFSQAGFTPDLVRASLHQRGHIYVPQSCAAGEPCRLHLAFHGCHQDEQEIGNLFYTRSGYNEWAESNHIIVLYPQATATVALLSLSLFNLETLFNPNGCWDWWGYTGGDYATRNGLQIKAIRAMIERLGAP